MENLPLVSYIVPIYNAVPFLQRTLDALAAQTYGNIEFILVDDGSTDGSAAVCDECCAKDSRFKCLHTANGGVSHARNAGIDRASGEYVMFCDADDIPHPDIVKTLVEKCRGDDIVLCGFRRVNGNKIREEAFSAETVYTQKSDIIRNLIMPMCVWDYSAGGKKHEGVFGSVWRGIYRKSLFADNGISFDFGVSLGEDLLVNTELFLTARSVRVIPDVLYTYTDNPLSATHTAIKMLWEKYLMLWKKISEMTHRYTNESDKKWLCFQLTRYAVSAVIDGVVAGNALFLEKKRAVKLILSSPEIKTAIRNLPDCMSIKDRVLTKLLRPSLSGAVLVYYSRLK